VVTQGEIDLTATPVSDPIEFCPDLELDANKGLFAEPLLNEELFNGVTRVQDAMMRDLIGLVLCGAEQP
jgi:hypothetical protein